MSKQQKIIKITLAILFTTSFAVASKAATFSLSGSYDFGANMLSNYDLSSGSPAGYGNTASYWFHRFYLRPDVVVDDRFTIRSEFNVLQLADQSGVNNVASDFGSSLDSSNTISGSGAFFELRKAYLEWASDWGIFKIGRQPKHWGLGAFYRAGSVSETIIDRVGFEGLVGNLHLGFGFEKLQEGKLSSDQDDAESYEISVEYINQGSLFNVGILYNRTVVSVNSSYSLPSEHLLGFYTRKRWSDLQLGAEFVSRGFEDVDGQIGLLAQVLYRPGKWSLGLDAGYASANGSSNFAFHTDYEPLVFLFDEMVGPQGGEIVNEGTNVGNAIASGTGAGAVFGVLTAAYGFSSGNYVLGFNLGFAQLAKERTSPGKSLGTEIDIHLTQKWYDNFNMSYALGFLMPGDAFGSNSQVGWGTKITGRLNF